MPALYISSIISRYPHVKRQPILLSPNPSLSPAHALPIITPELRWMVVRILIYLTIFFFFLSLTIVAILSDDSHSDSDVNVNLEASNEHGNNLREREAERVKDLTELMISRTFLHRLAPTEGVMGEVDANRTREVERRFRREEEEGERALLAAVRLGSVREEEEEGEEEQEEDERSPLSRGYGWQERRGYGYGAIGGIRTYFGVQIQSG